jgi:hypothetical protein
MNAYLRAAEEFPEIREQVLERASRRPGWAGKTAELEKLQAGIEKLAGRGGEPGKPDGPTPAPEPPGKPIRRAKDVLGRFKADDPSTPLDNEAWEERA